MPKSVQTAVLVGCGAMSEGWLRAIDEINVVSSRIKLLGFVDLDAVLAQRRAAASSFPEAKAGSDLAAMLAELQPDIVLDVVVPAARLTVVSTAFAAGCDVLSEKPLANTLDEARDLAKARDEGGRLHAVVQNRRHLTGIRRAKNFLESGAIGDVTEVHCDFFIAPHFGGFREQMRHVLLLDMAIHTFDAARFVAGLEPVRTVCLESNPAHSWFAHGASATALFECKGGVTMSYRGSWCAEGAPTSWEASWRIIGTKGTLLWDGNEGFRAEAPLHRDGLLSTHGALEIPDLATPLRHEGHAGVISDFLDARLEGRAPLTDARDNFHSLAMTFAAIESAEQGCFIKIPD